MYQGEPSEGHDFFELLLSSDEFCAELGRVTLSAGRLEGELILLLKENGKSGNFEKATMGKLIDHVKQYKLLDKSLIQALSDECSKRNYLTHNIFLLLSYIIDETILEREGLLDSDVSTYVYRANMTHENLSGLADIVKKCRSENA